MGKDKTYWFGILPHVYYVKKGVRILLYNTQNGSYIVSSDADVIALTEEMHLKNNLGIIELTQCQLQHSTIATFVQESKEKNICKLQERMPNSPKPVQLMPILNLQRDVEKLKQDKNRSVGEGIMDYLTMRNAPVVALVVDTMKNNSSIAQKEKRDKNLLPNLLYNSWKLFGMPLSAVCLSLVVTFFHIINGTS